MAHDDAYPPLRRGAMGSDLSQVDGVPHARMLLRRPEDRVHPDHTSTPVFVFPESSQGGVAATLSYENLSPAAGRLWS
ncbi:hypothetical protein ThrDRAFT_04704 [Frankia casuarinae]|nr:hypothetical protein ThrDRAFT_04704 [Frankia casuarinae]